MKNIDNLRREGEADTATRSKEEVIKAYCDLTKLSLREGDLKIISPQTHNVSNAWLNMGVYGHKTIKQ